MKTNPITKKLEEVRSEFEREIDRCNGNYKYNRKPVIKKLNNLFLDLLNTIESEVCGEVDTLKRFRKLQLLKDKLKEE